MVLVPDSQDSVSMETLALMTAPIEDFVIDGSEVAIRPTIG
jgi:hypothetical protein